LGDMITIRNAGAGDVAVPFFQTSCLFRNGLRRRLSQGFVVVHYQTAPPG
uniref:GcrA cell cycle regulator n=1 Tax=Haemonchus placei TaxID=6290 RepID=A0A0N4X6K0_HAEPC